MNSTNVTPHIMRHIPQLNVLDELKYLKCKVHFDMLHIMTDTLDEGYLSTFIKVHDFSSLPYKICFRYRALNGVEFSVLSDHRNQGTLFYQIQVNPIDFILIKDLRGFLEKLLGYRLEDSNHKVQRLDVAFSLDEKIFCPAMVFRCGQFKWKKMANSYLSNEFGSGMMTGTRTVSKSMNFCCYIGRKKKIKGRARFHNGYIRFEFQIKGCSLDSLGVRTFDSLYNIDIGKLLERMNFYDIRYITTSNTRKLKNFEAFQHDCCYLGFQLARLERNKNRTFNRDIGKYLVPLAINNGKVKVVTCLKRRFEEWFSVWKK